MFDEKNGSFEGPEGQKAPQSVTGEREEPDVIETDGAIRASQQNGGEASADPMAGSPAGNDSSSDSGQNPGAAYGSQAGGAAYGGPAEDSTYVAQTDAYGSSAGASAGSSQTDSYNGSAGYSSSAGSQGQAGSYGSGAGHHSDPTGDSPTRGYNGSNYAYSSTAGSQGQTGSYGSAGYGNSSTYGNSPTNGSQTGSYGSGAGYGNSSAYGSQTGVGYGNSSAYGSQTGNYDSGTGNNGQSGGTSYAGQTYQFAEESQVPEDPSAKKKRRKEKKEKKPGGTGKKWGLTIAMAAVFGLVAAAVFLGVTYTAGLLTGSNSVKETAEASAPEIGAGGNEDGSGSGADGSDSAAESASDAASDNTAIDVADVDDGIVDDVAKSAMPSMVTVTTLTTEEIQTFFGQSSEYQAEGAGTGVIVGENETELLIATNNHVIVDADSITVGFIDETTVDASLKGTDTDNDLAIVAVKLEDISEDTRSQIAAITIGDSDALELGDQVVAIGNALGYGQSVTAGYVSAFDRSLTLSYEDGTTFESTGLIQTDAAINGGNSGGALLNMRGELIGINEAKAGSSGYGTASVENMGYAIPIAKAMPILEDLMTMETRERVSEENAGYLGVTIADVTAESAQIYGMPQGACIYNIVPEGPSAAAGLKNGDIIVKFDGKTVSSYDTLKSIMEYYTAGETVDVTIARANEGEYVEHTYQVTLAAKDELDYESVQE